jgi:hypothetical protein
MIDVQQSSYLREQFSVVSKGIKKVEVPLANKPYVYRVCQPPWPDVNNSA